MRAAILCSVVAFAASALAQAVETGIGPDGESPPPGCKTTVDGNFTIGISFNKLNKRETETASQAAGEALQCTLKDGVLRDPYNRIGSIVANYQFQFDGPPQAGAIYTGGFSRCENGSLAIGSSTVWYRCMSGDFGNLYDRSIGDQCSEIRIVAELVDKPTPSSSSSSSAPTSSTRASSSAGGSITSASASSTLIPTNRNGNSTVSSGAPSSSGSSSGSILTASPSATDASSSSAASSESKGGAVPTRVPRRETFGAVIGILGAALIL